jgi:hypothetical protein
MSYREVQRKHAISLLDKIFKDPGNGIFLGKQYPFVLTEPELNLWSDIRQEAIDYFKVHKIPWWVTDDMPPGHLLSSQVACVNHLFPLHQRHDLATAILKNIDNRIVQANMVDGSYGYVDFEVIGQKNYLGEMQHTRGTNSTSIDAVMVGKKRDGGNILFVIEWKWTECYDSTTHFKPAHNGIYKPLLEKDNCPIKTNELKEDNYAGLYIEPFFQLMRQTLLGWRMVKANEYGCNEYINVHIIPNGNQELRSKNTAYPKLSGEDMPSTWRNVLKEPERYKVISPDELFVPLENTSDIKPLLTYLRERYWTNP